MNSAARKRVLSANKRLIVVAASGAFAGCSFLSAPEAAAVAFEVHPPSAHMLFGDTTAFYAWSCPKGGGCGNFSHAGSGNVASNWTIAGGAVAAVVAGGAVTNTVSSRTRIVVRGLAVGTSDLAVVAAGDSTLSRTVRVTVRDSAVISKIVLHDPYDRFPIFSGTTKIVFAYLADGQGTPYTTQPTSWSVNRYRDTRASRGNGTAQYVQ